MTADKELLTFAAKAAGIEVGVELPDKTFWLYNKDLGLVRTNWAHDRIIDTWNPLTDDGDLHRLARVCNIQINWVSGIAFVDGPVIYGIETYFTPGNDKEEAYAITRAAAEIGKRME